jgi:hypothetical protein
MKRGIFAMVALFLLACGRGGEVVSVVTPTTVEPTPTLESTPIPMVTPTPNPELEWERVFFLSYQDFVRYPAMKVPGLIGHPLFWNGGGGLSR